MVTSIASSRLVVFKKTVWVGIKPKHEKKFISWRTLEPCTSPLLVACVWSFVSLIIWSSKTCNLALYANLFLRLSHSQQTAPFFSTFPIYYIWPITGQLIWPITILLLWPIKTKLRRQNAIKRTESEFSIPCYSSMLQNYAKLWKILLENDML